MIVLKSLDPESERERTWSGFCGAVVMKNMQPGLFDQNLYMLRIDYDVRTDYGYEVNYLLYNYFIYFQLKYNQQLTTLIPRI